MQRWLALSLREFGTVRQRNSEIRPCEVVPLKWARPVKSITQTSIIRLCWYLVRCHKLLIRAAGLVIKAGGKGSLNWQCSDHWALIATCSSPSKYQCNKTYEFKTQCKGDIIHAFVSAKIIVFDPVGCKTPDAPLLNELLCWAFVQYS